MYNMKNNIWRVKMNSDSEKDSGEMTQLEFQSGTVKGGGFVKRPRSK